LHAKVTALTVYAAKGEAGKPQTAIRLEKDCGVEGDFHQGGDKQVSLLSAEARPWMEAQSLRGLCFDRYKENILIEGLSEENLKSGDLFSAGKAILRVSGAGKECFQECPLYSRGSRCLLAEGALFANVEESGYVQVGDAAKPMSASRFQRFLAKRL